MIALTLIFAVLATSAAVWFAAPLRGVLRAWTTLATAAIVAGTIGLYALGGQPDEPGRPYAQAAEARRMADPASLPREAQIETLRDRVRAEPGDGRAWALLGRELSRAGRHLEAVTAFETALRYEPDARHFSDLGQTLVNLNEGDVGPQARAAFEEAARRDLDAPEPAFFLGLGAYQDGDRALAASRWTQALGRLDPDNPLRAIVARRTADLLSRPDVSAAQVSAAADDEGAAPEDRIGRMVAGLEARLASQPDDLSGWLVLMRVKATMGDYEGAAAALGAADARFGDDPGAAVVLAEMRGALGMDGER